MYSTRDKDGNSFSGGVHLNPTMGSTTTGRAITITSRNSFQGDVSWSEGKSLSTISERSLSMAAYAKKFGLSY